MSFSYSLRKEHIAEILGLTDEAGGDETVVNTVNVRLEQMFRQEIDATPELVMLHGEDLEKLANWSPAWRGRGKRIETQEFPVKRADGLTRRLMTNLNAAPGMLAEQLRQTGRFIFCHSPILDVNREAGYPILKIWMRVIFAPEELDPEPDNEDPGGAAGEEGQQERSRQERDDVEWEKGL